MGRGPLTRLAALAAFLSAQAPGPTRHRGGNPRRRNWLKGVSRPGGAPYNRDQERARRRRQIESGMLKLGPEGGKYDWGSEP